jgi:hypothetical protein
MSRIPRIMIATITGMSRARSPASCSTTVCPSSRSSAAVSAIAPRVSSVRRPVVSGGNFSE